MTLDTNSEEKTKLDDELSVCSVENTQMTDGETPYVHVCTKCNVESKSRIDKTDRNHSKKRETRLGTVQPHERQTKTGKVPSLEEFTVEMTRDAYCR